MAKALKPEAALALELIRLLYQVDVTVIQEEADIEAFSARHRFHALQYMFSPEALRQLFQRLGERQVYLTTDAFRVRAALLTLGGTPLLLGPFTSLLLGARDVRTLLKRYPLPGVSEDALLHYVNSFPCISETEIAHLLTSLLLVLCPDEPAREIVSINYLETAEYESEDRLAGKREDAARLLERRYVYEQDFILAVMAGNARAAIRELRNMQQDVAYLKRIGTTLENERIGAAIVRTTTRLAARQAGLPNLILDKISTENTLASFRGKTVEEILQAQETMVREFCKAVQRSKEEKHSALVQSAIYCIEKDYVSEVSVSALAEELDVSVNHLIRIFKKEMQVTPNVYLRQVRLRQAARLLAATDLPVQEIASAVGIMDANYMIKLFRAQYGETPLAYRKKYRL